MATTNSTGDTIASQVMLDCLVIYNDWFQCLMKVLRHHDVKLTHVADVMEEAYEKLCKDLNYRPQTSVENAAADAPPDPPVKTDNETEDKTNEAPKEDPLNTFELEIVDRKSEPEPVTQPEPESNLEADAIDADAEEVYNTCQFELPDPDASLEPDYEEQDIMAAANGVQARPLPAIPVQSKFAKISDFHGPEYDFSLQETREALGDILGWHDGISERKVEEVLYKLRGEDGHYILWYWERKRRPALCITYKKSIKTFIVHKRFPRMRTGRLYFYILREGKYDTELKAIVLHHIEEGIHDTRGHISLVKPVKPLP